MATFLYIIFFLSCIMLITSILLQPGKADAGALFTSNISSTAFGPRGTQSVLSKFTIAMAALFMLTALLLSMPAITGDVSILNRTSSAPVETTVPATAPQTDSNVNTNAAIPADTNSNANGTTSSSSSQPANK